MASNPLTNIPLIGGLFSDKEDRWEQEYQRALDEIRGVQVPDLLYQEYKPEEFQYQTIQESPELRTRQLGLLSKMADYADTGFTESDKASYDLATQRAQQAARQRDAALAQQAQARGVGGSGVELAMRQQSGQDALQAANEANLARAADSARQKALYQQAYGGMLGNVREQDYRPLAANVDTINKFNTLNTEARNLGRKYNIEQQQNLAQQGFQNRLGKAQSVAGAGQQLGNVFGSQSAAEQASRDKWTDFLTQAVAGKSFGKGGGK